MKQLKSKEKLELEKKLGITFTYGVGGLTPGAIVYFPALDKFGQYIGFHGNRPCDGWYNFDEPFHGFGRSYNNGLTHMYWYDQECFIVKGEYKSWRSYNHGNKRKDG